MKMKLKNLSIRLEQIDGITTNVVTVNRIKHTFNSYDAASKFHRKEYANAGIEGYDGAVSVVAQRGTKAELKFLCPKMKEQKVSKIHQTN